MIPVERPAEGFITLNHTGDFTTEVWIDAEGFLVIDSDTGDVAHVFGRERWKELAAAILKLAEDKCPS